MAKRQILQTKSAIRRTSDESVKRGLPGSVNTSASASKDHVVPETDEPLIYRTNRSNDDLNPLTFERSQSNHGSIKSLP
jgi:hypothetical protein